MWWWGACAGAACCSDAALLRETRAHALDDLRPLLLERASSFAASGHQEQPDGDASQSSALHPAPGLYTARYRHSQELVALKVFRKALLARKETRRRLRREVRVLSLCREHPHLLTLIGVYSTSATFEIAFELARGGEVLNRILAQPPPLAASAAGVGSPAPMTPSRHSTPTYVFSEAEASRVIGSVVEGLCFLHARGIIHGEVRPEHVLYSDAEPDARVLLADFGRAAPWDAGGFTLKCRRARRSCAPRFLWHDAHHIRFLPPFALRRQDDALRSWREAQQIDTWALGVTMYALLCASLPFDGEDALERTARGVLSDPVCFPDGGATISRAARDLLQRLLAKDPDDALSIEQVSAHPWLRDGCATADPWPTERVDEHRAFALAYADEVASLSRRRRVSTATYAHALRDRDPTAAPSSISSDEHRDEYRLPRGVSGGDSDETSAAERPSFVSTHGDTQQILELRAEDEPLSADGYMRLASEEIDACGVQADDAPPPGKSAGDRRMDSRLWRVLTKQRRFFSFRSASSSTKSDSDAP